MLVNGKEIDPASVGVNDIKEAVAAGLDTGFQTNRAFLEGDHWQNQTGWVGPRPRAGEEGEQATWDEISRAFTSKNVLLEIRNRHVAGVLGREPGWTIVPKRPMKPGELPNDSEKTAIEEINSILTEWWDKRNAHGILATAVENVLYSQRGIVRLFVPASKLTPGADGASTVTVETPLDAALAVYPEAPLPEQAAVYVDADTKDVAGFLAVERDNKISGEVVFLRVVEAGSAPAAGASLSADGAPLTAIRTFNEDSDSTVDIPLGGRLTMMEINRTPLLTEQMRQAQRALNLALSMVPRNVVTGGFLERILTNAQLPGTWEKDEETGIERFVPSEYPTGAGTTTFLSGIESDEDSNGKRVITSPGVFFREPVPVTSSVDGKQSHYEDMLDEAGQRHVLMGSEATASGYSREQARADFEETLKVTLGLLVPLGRWLLETVLAMTEAFTNSPGKWSDLYRVEFRPYVNTGPLSSDEIRVLNESVKANTISMETAMQRMQIPDVNAELARISAQPDAKMALLERQSVVLKTLTDAGVPLDVAGAIAGMEPEQISALKQAQAAKDKAKEDAAKALANNPQPTGGQPQNQQ